MSKGTLWGVLLLTLAVLGNTGASLVLKWASLPQYQVDVTSSSLPPMRAVGLAAALICYALAFVSYFLALRTFPVSVAYPLITSISVALITVAANHFFNEPITLQTLFGTMFILVGIVILMGGTR